MNRNLEQIAIAAARECIRQDVDEYALIRLLDAHWYAWRHHTRTPTEGDILELAFKIEPLHNSGYRKVPVTFADLSTGADWKDVPYAMSRLCDVLEGDPLPDVDAVTKAVLNIHPFRDGNGRVAWVLHNWLGRTLHEPVALPEFYGATA